MNNINIDIVYEIQKKLKYWDQISLKSVNKKYYEYVRIYEFNGRNRFLKKLTIVKQKSFRTKHAPMQSHHPILKI